MKRFILLIALTMSLINAGCQKEPAKIAVESVTLNTTTISLTEGESAAIFATISPSDATNQKVLWTTGNPSVATVENGKVKAISAGNATITATTDDGGKTATCEVTVKAKEIKITGLSLDKNTLELEIGGTGTLTAIITPSDATNKTLIWSSDNEEVASVSEEGVVSALKEGTVIVTVTTVDQGKTASCKVTVTSPGPSEPDAIDLGLPSGLKWASCNLGATKPEEYGGYYQWAGTENVSDTSIYLDWSNCPYHTGSDDTAGWTKYIPTKLSSYWSGAGSPDNKKYLDPEDDPAHVILGGKWRMPTYDEVTELKTECTSKWTTMNGVKGIRFTSPTNGNSIFLPAAGFRDVDNLGGAGSYGYYWSSLLKTSEPTMAYRLYFLMEGAHRNSVSRYLGLSVRPVTD